MAFKDMLACLDSYPDASSSTAVDQTARLAAALGGGVCAVAVHVRIPLRSNPIAERLLRLGDVARQEETRSLQNAQAVQLRFLDAAAVAGISATTAILDTNLYEVSDRVTEVARTRDLCLIPFERMDDGQAALAEAVIFGSGRPAVVFAAGEGRAVTARLKRIVVAWDGGRAAARAVADAMPVFVRATEVRILSVLNEKPAVKRGSAADLARHLAAGGVAATVDEVDGGDRDIGESLVSYAGDHAADLLVMGAFGHSRVREFVLGGATQSLLRSPIVPVFMSH